MWALRGLSADEFLDELLGRELFLWKQVRSSLEFAEFQFFLFAPAGEEAVVSDFCKTRRQNVHEKSPNKLVGVQGHHFPLAAVPVIPPLESDGIVLSLQNTIVGDCHPMGVAPEVFHDTGCIPKRRLAVNYPFLLVALIQQILVNIGHLKL